MANKKISQLTAIVTVDTAADLFPIVDTSAIETKSITPSALKTALSLNNVDNTTDANKPVSTATQTALNAKQDTLVSATNIKTINSTSILGSGNIVVGATPSGIAGAVQFSDGSAFSSDATKFFWDDTNNRLGIGTSAPTQVLEVAKNANSDTRLLISNTDTTNTSSRASLKVSSGSVIGQIIAISGDDVYMGANASNVRIGANGGTDILVSTTGNVSVGTTTNLGARLGIKGSGSTSATTALLVQNSAGTEVLKVRDDGAVRIGGNGITGLLSLIDTNGTLQANISATTSGLNFAVNAGNQFFLNNATNSSYFSGQLGIGTTSPTAQLQVKGSGSTSATTSLLVQNSSAATSMAILDDGKVGIGTSAPTTALEVAYNSSTLNGILINQLGASLDSSIGFANAGVIRSSLSMNINTGECRWTASSGGYFPTIYSSGVERFRIATSGNVGIGETAPTARLQVKGSGATSATTSLLVQNSAGTAALTVKDDLNIDMASGGQLNVPTGGILSQGGVKANDSSWGVGWNNSSTWGMRGDSGKIGFGSGSTGAGALDTAISRNAAGVLEVNNGTMGTLAAINVASYKVNGTSGFTGTGIYTTLTIVGGIITNAT